MQLAELIRWGIHVPGDVLGDVLGVDRLRMPFSGFFGTSLRVEEDLSDRMGEGCGVEFRDAGALNTSTGVDVRVGGGFLGTGLSIGVLGGGCGVDLGVVQQEEEAMGRRGAGARIRGAGEGA